MKILVYTDNHFCQNSSIVRGRGDVYSDRLENQIQTLNWLESLADTQGCDLIINAGDFFDRPDLNSEEISALKAVRWSEHVWHFFLVGNHDASVKSLQFNSQNVFTFIKNADVIDHPCIVGCSDVSICFIPYTSQTAADKPLLIQDLVKQENPLPPEKTLLISHNDLKDVRFGGFVSKTGLSVEDVEEHCALCINGHLHNHFKVTNKILNLGNITGQNFSEDAEKYKHYCAIVDTENMVYKLIENPFALNFYRIDLSQKPDFLWETLNQYSVVTVQCAPNYAESVAQQLSKNHVRYSRILTTTPRSESGEQPLEDLLSVDHRKEFCDFVLGAIGSSDLLKEELSLVCKE